MQLYSAMVGNRAKLNPPAFARRNDLTLDAPAGIPVFYGTSHTGVFFRDNDQSGGPRVDLRRTKYKPICRPEPPWSDDSRFANFLLAINSSSRYFLVIFMQSYCGIFFLLMLGKVWKAAPAGFQLSDRLDSVTAIALSGGMTGSVNAKKLTVICLGKDMKLYLKEISQRSDGPSSLLPDDVITVGEHFF